MYNLWKMKILKKIFILIMLLLTFLWFKLTFAYEFPYKVNYDNWQIVISNKKLHFIYKYHKPKNKSWYKYYYYDKFLIKHEDQTIIEKFWNELLYLIKKYKLEGFDWKVNNIPRIRLINLNNYKETCYTYDIQEIEKKYLNLKNDEKKVKTLKANVDKQKECIEKTNNISNINNWRDLIIFYKFYPKENGENYKKLKYVYTNWIVYYKDEIPFFIDLWKLLQKYEKNSKFMFPYYININNNKIIDENEEKTTNDLRVKNKQTILADFWYNVDIINLSDDSVKDCKLETFSYYDSNIILDSLKGKSIIDYEKQYNDLINNKFKDIYKDYKKCYEKVKNKRHLKSDMFILYYEPKINKKKYLNFIHIDDFVFSQVLLNKYLQDIVIKWKIYWYIYVYNNLNKISNDIHFYKIKEFYPNTSLKTFLNDLWDNNINIFEKYNKIDKRTLNKIEEYKENLIRYKNTDILFVYKNKIEDINNMVDPNLYKKYYYEKVNKGELLSYSNILIKLLALFLSFISLLYILFLFREK